MTAPRLQIEYPRNIRGQIPNAVDAQTLDEVNQRLRAIYDTVNNLAGTGNWLYVGRDIPFGGGWVNYSSVDATFGGYVRFRREGYDTVRFEGHARMNPFNAANTLLFQVPTEFVPGETRVRLCDTGGNGGIRIDVRGWERTSPEPGQVMLGNLTGLGAGSTDFVSLDGLTYTLSPSR